MKPFGRDRHRSQQVQRDNVLLPGGVGGVPPSLFPLPPLLQERGEGVRYKYKKLCHLIATTFRVSVWGPLVAVTVNAG